MIKLALLGCGKWANNYIDNINVLSNYAEIKYLYSRSSSSYLSLKQKPKNDHSWTWDLNKILNDPEIQGVIIATPPDTHYNLALSVIQAGKHVLCEKPFVLENNQAEELFKLAETNKVSLVVNFIHLWNKFYQDIYRDKNISPDNIEKIIFEVEAPNQNREHHSVLYDWASHDLAMLLHLYQGSFPTDIRAEYDLDILKDRKINLNCKVKGSECSILINCNSDKRARRVSVYCKNGYFKQTRDTFEYNALREVVVDFLNAITHNIAVNNREIAIGVTRLLNIISENKTTDL